LKKKAQGEGPNGWWRGGEQKTEKGKTGRRGGRRGEGQEGERGGLGGLKEQFETGIGERRERRQSRGGQLAGKKERKMEKGKIF